jgi:hypothetical protein
MGKRNEELVIGKNAEEPVTLVKDDEFPDRCFLAFRFPIDTLHVRACAAPAPGHAWKPTSRGGRADSSLVRALRQRAAFMNPR